MTREMTVSTAWEIRRAVPADAPFLPDVEISAGIAFLSVPGLEWVADDEVWSAEEHREWMDRATVWIAHDENGKPGAFLITEIFETELHIWEISVHHDGQGQGLGRRLMMVADDYARSKGMKALTLTTFRDLKFNEGFYANLGFETLDSDRISDRLQKALAHEADEGLPLEKRCAMRKVI